MKKSQSAKSSAMIGTAIVCSIGLALPVYAQDTTDNSQAEEGASADRARNAPIVVTATRREVFTKDLPLSITAISGAELEQNQKDDLSDYIRQVPSVSFRQQSAGLNQITIRGVSSGGGQRAKAPVSFYIDDVPVISDPVATPDIKSFDINRVEVLRGPQGTLFGESALGGVIRVLFNQPDTDEFAGRFRTTYVNFKNGGDGYNLDAMLNVPIIKDKLALRTVVSRRDEDGWIDNIGIGGRDNANDLDYWSARSKLLFTPSDDLSLSAMYFMVRSDYGSRQEGNIDFEQTINFTNENRIDDIDQFNFTAKYNFGGAELTSSTNYFDRETSRLFNLNFFNGFLPATLEDLGVVGAGFQFDEFAQTLNVDDETFVQEVRLVSTGSGPFRWVVGGYYLDTDNFVGVDFFGTPETGFNYLSLRRDESYQQIAGFTELEYDLSDKFTVIGGLRWTREDRTIQYDQTDDFPDQVFLPANGLFEVDFDYNVLTPKLALQYRITDDSQVYASATRGFRGPGGNTDFNDSGIRANVYGAETIWSYEIGTKASLFDRLVNLEAALFYTDWSDRQEVVNPEAPTTEQFVDNIGSAEIKGVEFGLVVQPSTIFSFGGNLAYIDTEITQSSRVEFEGLGLPGEPEWRWSLFGDAAVPVSNDLTLRFHADATYSGDVFYSLTNPIVEPGYVLANSSISLEGDSWAASVFVRNLTDEFVRYGTGPTTSINEPRVFGFSIDKRF